jgi:hypothetical protein
MIILESVFIVTGDPVYTHKKRNIPYFKNDIYHISGSDH